MNCTHRYTAIAFFFAVALALHYGAYAQIGTNILTNRSGAQVDLYDTVVVDSGNDRAFTTTTTERDRRVAGVVASASIANGSTGNIVLLGIHDVTVTGSVARGDYLITSTVTGTAQSGGSEDASQAFGVALEAGTDTEIAALISIPGVGGGIAGTGASGNALVSGNLTLNDDNDLVFGSDDDIRMRYDEAGDDRLEFHDGTNLLAWISDAGTTGTAGIAGNLFHIDQDTAAGDAELRLDAGSGGISRLSYYHDGANQWRWEADFGAAGDMVLARSGVDIPITVDTTGAITLARDFALNSDDLTTNQTAFNLVDTTATTVNFAGAATTVDIGAVNSTVTLPETLRIGAGDTGVLEINTPAGNDASSKFMEGGAAKWTWKYTGSGNDTLQLIDVADGNALALEFNTAGDTAFSSPLGIQAGLAFDEDETVDDATPSVTDIAVLVADPTTGTTITSFDDATGGQTVYLVNIDGANDITVNDTGNIALSGGVSSLTLSQGEGAMFVFIATDTYNKWVHIGQP